MRYRRAVPWGLAFIVAEGRIVNRKIQAMVGKVDVLQSLLAVRQEHERRAERALGAVLAARVRAEAEAARLTADALAARATLAAGRREDASSDARAGDALGRQRFLARLAGDVEACLAATRAFAAETLAPARAAEVAARAAHVRAHQRREVVERAIERRAAAARREADRREEAAADDRPNARPGARRRR
jgi:hypothetical protein